MTDKTHQIAGSSPQEKRRLLEQLLKVKAGNRASGSQKLGRVDVASGPLSSAQKRLWYLDQLTPGDPFYNLALGVRLTGQEVVPDALEKAFKLLAERHRALRTAFRDHLGEPRQEVLQSPAGPLRIFDLTGEKGEDQETEARRIAFEVAQEPFDLKAGYLIRLVILRLRENDAILLVVAHHIIFDGWSFGIFERELSALYRSSLEGVRAGVPPGPPLAVQLIDFALWEEQLLKSETTARRISYWRRQLGGLEPLQLPSDRPRHEATHAGATHWTMIPKTVVQGLEDLARSNDGTLFMVLLAAFQVLLYRMTAQPDIAVGSPITNRDREEFEALIGFFSNNLVLRSQLDPQQNFSNFLHGVRRMALEAYENAQVPFETLVEALQPERDEGSNPFVQIGFALQPQTPLAGIDFPGTVAKPWRFEAGLTKMDLEFHLVSVPTGIRGHLFYFKDLFDSSTIHRLSRQYEALLRVVIAAPQTPIGRLSLLPPVEQHQLLVEWNDTSRSLASEALTHERVVAWAGRQPEGVAIEAGRETLTWDELERRSASLANRLLDLGVGQETLVALWMDRSPRMISGMLAVLRAGGAYLPLDPAHPEGRLVDLVRSAGAQAILTVPETTVAVMASEEIAHLPVVELGEGGEKLCRSSLSGGVNRLRGQQPTPENLAYVIYTSGSTGAPKGVEISHGALLNLVECPLFGYRAGERRTQVAAPGFDGTVFEIWPALAAGVTLVLVDPEPREDPALLPAWLKEKEIQVCSLPTPLAEAALAAPWPEGLSLRALHAAGDRLHRAAVKEIGADLFNVYGPTEAASTTTWGLVARGKGDPPIGRPIPNHRVYVLDRQGQAVPIGAPGELVIGGVGLARGYRGEPARSADRFLPDPFGPEGGARMYRTGDLVRLRADGQIEFLGRVDHQVKIRGHRIELGEVAAVLGSFAGLVEWTIVDRRRSNGTKELVAYVVSRSAAPPTSAELAAFLGEKLPSYMVPSALVVLPILPRTPNGKVDRKALPAPERDHRAAHRERVAPRTAAEEAMAELWAEVLGVASIGVLDTFFELGGHSLLATRLVAEIRRRFNTDLSLQELFRHSSVARLTALVQARKNEARTWEELPQVIPAPETAFQPFALTSVQQAYLLGRGASFELGNVSAHGYLEFEHHGWQVDRIEAVIRQLVDRHSMLRAVFSENLDQRILEQVPAYEVRRQDLRSLSEAEVELRIAAWRQEMSHQVLPADRWPLFDVRVSLLDGDRLRLHIDGDGLFADAWSLALIAREAIALYGAPDLLLSPLELTFRDCVLAEKAYQSSKAAEESRQYWRERLPQMAPAPELPLARNPESLDRPRFVGRAFRLEPEVWGALKERAAKAGLTASGLLLAAYAEVLGRWSKSPRMTLNLTTFNRRPWHPQVGQLVGDFTTLTLLGLDAQGERFVDRALRVQERLWSDLEHNQVDGLEVMRDLARRGQVSQAGLMPVVFSSILGQAPGGGTEFSAGWQEKILYRITQTPQIWLDHQVTEEKGALNTNWDSVEDLFPPGLLDDLFAAYESLLRLLAAGEEAWQWKQPVTLPEQQAGRRDEVNQTSAAVSEDRLQDGFLRQAKARPEALAVLSPEKSLTYEEVHALSGQLAWRLREAGLVVGQAVAVVMEKGWEQVVAVLAILRAGGAYLPVDATLPRERIGHLLGYLVDEAAEVEGVVPLVVSQPWISSSKDWPAPVRRFDVEDGVGLSRGREPEDLEVSEVPSTGLAYVIFTSGSTGLPKGVMIDHRGAINTIRDINGRFALEARDRVLALSSLSFDLSVWDVFGVLGAGGTIVLPAPDRSRDPSHWMDLLATHGVTVWNSVPALMELLVDSAADTGRRLPESLRLVMMSGDWIPLSLPPKIQALGPEEIRLISLGGATEASIWSILYPIETLDSQWKSIPYGRPMVNQTFHVLDEDLVPRPDWVPGELYIGGIGVALGYWRDEVRTAQRFIEHPETGERLYRTGDLGRYLPDGTIEFLGREDAQVKVNGYRIELGEIEVALARHPAVRSAVAAAPGDRGNRRLVAYYLTEEGAIEDQELRAFMAESLPDYMVPSAFVKLETAPLTVNGKVDRSSLPLPSAAKETSREGSSDLAQRIAALSAQVLGEEALDPQANLLEAGASSLHMIRIANLLEHELGLRPSIEDFYRTPTVAALAIALGSAKGLAETSTVVATAATRWSPGPPLEPMAIETFKRQRWDRRRKEGGRVFPLPALSSEEIEDPSLGLRRSTRLFAPEALPLENLSRLLAALREGSVNGLRKRFYPSAGGLYPVQVYLHVRPERVLGLGAGTYYFHPEEHRLLLLSKGDLDPHIHDPFVNRPIYEGASFSFFFIAQAAAIVPVYRESARDFSLLEAGYMGQLLMMQAAACGIGLCPIGGVQIDLVQDLFLLDESHELIHSMVGGALLDLEGREPPESAWREPAFSSSAAQASASVSDLPALVPTQRGENLPLSFSQKRMWMAHRLDPENPAYNTAVQFRITGLFDLRAFEEAIAAVFHRHEVLRTTYPLIGDEPAQRIASPSPWILPVIDLSLLEDATGEADRLVRRATGRSFDLATGPTLRAFALKFGASTVEHRLYLAMHHIVGDAWSTGIMIRELAEFYHRALGASPSPLPALPVQVADFAQWQRRLGETSQIRQQLRYWKEQLAGLPLLDLPTDFARSRENSYGGQRLSFEVPATLASPFESLARSAGASPFVSYLSAFKLVLGWLSGQDDVAVGSPVTHRDRLEIEALIGFFVNTVVLRTALGGDLEFREVLLRVRETVHGAYAHRDVPFEQVLEGLEVDRGVSDTPLFRVWFVLHEVPPPAFELYGLRVEAEEVGTAAARYDLKVELVRQPGGGIRGEMEYRTSLFERATIEGFVASYLELLGNLSLESRRQPIWEALTLADTERRRSLRDSFRESRGQGLRRLGRREGRRTER